MIAIIDYGSGNAGSVKNMLDFLKVESRITNKIEDLENSEAIILPGVGSFGQCIHSLEELQLKKPLINILNKLQNNPINNSIIKKNIKIIKNNSNIKENKIIFKNNKLIIEKNRVSDKNILNKDQYFNETKNKKLKNNNYPKKFLGICIGMQVLFEKSEEGPGINGLGIFEGNVKRFKNGKIPQIGWNVVDFRNGIKGNYFYFVNSYYCNPKDRSIILGKTNYNGNFASAIQKNNITATQYHVEKSGKAGIEFMRWWLSC